MLMLFQVRVGRCFGCLRWWRPERKQMTRMCIACKWKRRCSPTARVRGTKQNRSHNLVPRTLSGVLLHANLLARVFPHSFLWFIAVGSLAETGSVLHPLHENRKFFRVSVCHRKLGTTVVYKLQLPNVRGYQVRVFFLTSATFGSFREFCIGRLIKRVLQLFLAFYTNIPQYPSKNIRKWWRSRIK